MVGLLLSLIPTIEFLLFGLNKILLIVVLEEQLAVSHHEVEEAHLRGGFLGEDHRRGAASRAKRGATLVDDLITAAEAALAIVKMEGSLCSCG